jgi:hypothetical protein
MSRRYVRNLSVGYGIPVGDHFGTAYRSDVVPAYPVLRASSFWENLAEPRELIAIWVADSWLMNLDRDVYGNLMMEPGAHRKWHLLAADQSDCFLGASTLADGSCFERSRRHGSAAYLPGLEATLLRLGIEPLHEVAAQIEGARASVAEAISWVPKEWWLESNVSPQAVAGCLAERAGRIREIIQIEHWEGVWRAIKGGFHLGR